MALSPQLVGFIQLLASQVAADPTAIQLKDMVLVEDPARPFLIDIFEMNYTEAGQKGGNNPNKAARLETLDAAKEACKKLGKRVPTEKEWRAAASANGKNKTYTLAGDQIYANPKDKQGLKVRLGGQNSSQTRDVAVLGIDAIGTVGMTGNRAEWVIGQNDASVQCGFGYESKETDLSFVELRNICTADDKKWSAQADKKTATVRCVLDVEADKSYQITYTDDVQGELRELISDITGERYERWSKQRQSYRVATNLVFLEPRLITREDILAAPRITVDGTAPAETPAANPPVRKKP